MEQQHRLGAASVTAADAWHLAAQPHPARVQLFVNQSCPAPTMHLQCPAANMTSIPNSRSRSGGRANWTAEAAQGTNKRVKRGCSIHSVGGPTQPYCSPGHYRRAVCPAAAVQAVQLSLLGQHAGRVLLGVLTPLHTACWTGSGAAGCSGWRGPAGVPGCGSTHLDGSCPKCSNRSHTERHGKTQQSSAVSVPRGSVDSEASRAGRGWLGP